MIENSITAGEAKADLFALLDAVASSGQHFTVTHQGKPLADIVPHVHDEADDLRHTARQLVSDAELLAPFDDKRLGAADSLLRSDS